MGHRSRINHHSSNQPLKIESVAARVLKLLQVSATSSSFFKVLEAVGRARISGN